MNGFAGKWMMIALVAAPCGVFAAGRFLLARPGPSVAAADEFQQATETAPLIEFEATDGELMLATSWRDLDIPITHPTPFYQSRVIEPMTFDEPVVAPVVEPKQEAPSIALTAVMGGRRPVAVVEGRMLSVGSEIANGWFVTRIDANTQSIEVATHDGETLTVEVGDHLQ